mgnify:CR=1 FL=1
MCLSSTGLELPDPFGGRREEDAVTKRMAGTRRQVNDLLQEGWGPGAVDEVRAPATRPGRGACSLPGRRTKLYVDREKASQSFL